MRRLSGNNIFNTSSITDFDNLYSNNQYNSDIVFFGNSITRGVDWNELLGLNISNQGLGGNTTEQLLNRIDNVIKENPKHVFVMCGINDIYKDILVENIYENYLKLIEVLIHNEIEPVIQSTFFVSSTINFSTVKISKNVNLKVSSLNSKLKQYCDDNSIVFIDVNQSLSIDNYLNQEFSRDGVHLNSLGYEIWYKNLIPVLYNLGYYKNLSGEIN